MPVPQWLRRGSSFAKNTFGRSTRARRGLAACAVVLAAGGLVLFRAPHGVGATPSIPQVIPQVAPEPELPKLPISPTITGANSATFSGPGAHGSLALSHSKVLSDGRQPLYAELQVRADKEDQKGVHAPLSIAVVLDTSGSMSGDKIEQAKEAVIKLIRQMDDADELAVIRYSDEASTVMPLGRVSEVRAQAIARVKNLEADGGTAIPRGLALGLGQVGTRSSERVRRVILVSDGLDSTRAQAERLAANSFERGIVVSSLGIGLDFDEGYMSSVASRGHGNFGFVKDAPALATFLKRELDETAKTVVENATVRITLPQGVTFQRASGADARTVGSGEIELKLGSLFSGDERRVLIEMESNRPEVRDAMKFLANAAWDRVGGEHANVDVAPLTVVATNDPAEVEKGRDPTVLASAASVLASRRQMEAAEAYNRGDVRKAEALADESISNLQAAASAAPAPVAAALAAQQTSYKHAKSGFRSFAAGSSEAKELSKSVVQDEARNMARKAY